MAFGLGLLVILVWAIYLGFRKNKKIKETKS
jgi:hypothetical protein